MATPHINAKSNDFAKVVLMPGDPKRAKWIVDNFLHDAVEITNVRGMLGFTGYTKNNKKISVMASGMGQPSIGIYSHELFTVYGVEIIIRVGTCGGYQPDIKLKDIIIGVNASTDSSWPNQFKVNGIFSPCANLELIRAATDACDELHYSYHAGNILSSDIFYDYDPNSWKNWADLGVLAVEMESYALYANAARQHKKALCLLTATDSFVISNKLTAEERVEGLSQMIEVAIKVAEKYAD